MIEQLHHQNNKFSKREFPIILICDRVNSPANIGSIFRIADAYGIEKIYFCGPDILLDSKRMFRTSRNTHRTVPYEQYEDTLTAVTTLQQKEYTILPLEITSTSLSISEYKVVPNQKIALVIGEENFGVNSEILKIASTTVHLEMYGTNSSMNVATATGIALYEVTKQMLQLSK